MDDIAIIDLDLKKTTWSRVHSSMRTLYLKLSAEPDIDWMRFFREERESRVVVKRHGLWIEDGFIVFDCLLGDVENWHLPDFRKSIEYANVKCRELKAKRKKDSHQRRRDERSEKEALELLREQIRDERPGPTNGARLTEPESAPARSVADAGFDAKRNELRARFRAALKSRTKEPDGGND